MFAKLFLFAIRYPSVRRVIWKPLYNFLARRFPFKDWHFMNYGYTPFPYEPKLELPENQEFTRYSIQLYHFLANKTELAGKNVLEVGSGRGGGAKHIAQYFKPASMIGMDIAENAVEFSNLNHCLPNLRYVQGDAENLPFEDNRFDVVINVESSHAYGSMPQFLSEVKRVLKPGGYFMITDIKLAPDTEILKEQLKNSGMEYLEEEDITDNVVRAIELEDPIKQQRMQNQIPKKYIPLFAQFAGGVNSEIHRSLKTRVRTYYRFVLRKALLATLFGVFFHLTISAQEEIGLSDSPSAPALSYLKYQDLLQQYIRFPSVSGKEKEAGAFLLQACAEMGLHTRLFQHPNGAFNFAASLYPLENKKPNLIFLAHIDVVSAADSAEWLHPPFEGKLVDGAIWGRGAFDNKGLTIIQLAALERFLPASRQIELPYNLTLLAVSCEETQCTGGARYVVDSFLHELNAYAVFGEGIPPFQGVWSENDNHYFHNIGVNHKRPYWLQLELEIPTHGHGSVTPLSYANQEMIKSLNRLVNSQQKAVFTDLNTGLLEELGKMEGGLKGFILKNPRFFKPLLVPQLRKHPEIFALFSNTVTITNLKNPTDQHNLIPEKITCLLDCRLLPQADEKRFLKDLRRSLKNPKIQIHQVMTLPSAPNSPTDHPVYEKICSVILEYYDEPTITPLFLPNYTDLVWFRLKGIPTYNLAPFRVTRAQLEALHGHNESISVTSIQEGIEVFTLVIEKIMDFQLSAITP